MSFTSTELDNITTAKINSYLKKGGVSSQTIQKMPLLKKLMAKQKTFPVGGDITVNAKGDNSTTVQFYSGADKVTYPAPAKLAT